MFSWKTRLVTQTVLAAASILVLSAAAQAHVGGHAAPVPTCSERLCLMTPAELHAQLQSLELRQAELESRANQDIHNRLYRFAYEKSRSLSVILRDQEDILKELRRRCSAKSMRERLDARAAATAARREQVQRMVVLLRVG